MFILSFIVVFGIKKGSIISYKSGWSSLLNQQLIIILNKLNLINMTSLTSLLIYRFHFTTITSRSTSYILFFF
jgi:hypothetical protein